MQFHSFDDLPRDSLLQVPRQARSATRVHAILDGAIRVLVELGTDGFNTNQVAAASAVSVGSVYQYFSNKQSILSGVLERGVLHSEALMWGVFEQGVDQPLRETIAAGLHGLVDLLLPHRELIEALLNGAPMLGRGSSLAPIERVLLDLAHAWIERHGGQPPETGATLYVGVSGGLFVFLKWLVEQPPEMPRRDFVPALTEHAAAAIERA
ncbi:MAG: TetR/AcrR family transcriptional regulator [Deltaproteobacteria bacterium]|nr:TetR/AcrR family transcriptional regulator [Deltaproteobacteria bacterium]